MLRMERRATSFLSEMSRKGRRPVQRRPPAPPAFRPLATVSFAELVELTRGVHEQVDVSVLAARLSLDTPEVVAFEERLLKLRGSPAKLFAAWDELQDGDRTMLEDLFPLVRSSIAQADPDTLGALRELARWARGLRPPHSVWARTDLQLAKRAIGNVALPYELVGPEGKQWKVPGRLTNWVIPLVVLPALLRGPDRKVEGVRA